MTEAIRYAKYARFSDDKQNPLSVEDQFAVCDERVAKHDWVRTGEYADRAQSGEGTRRRPGLLRLIEDAKAHKFDVIVVESLDRLSRRPSDAHKIFEVMQFHEVGIYTLSDNAFLDSTHLTFRAYQSAEHQARLRQSVARGLGKAAERGIGVGKFPHGYKLQRSVEKPKGDWIIDEQQAETVRWVFAQYASGASGAEIARALNTRNVPLPDNRKWRKESIMHMLRRKIYIGRYAWGTNETRLNPETNSVEYRKRDKPTFERENAKWRIIDDIELWNAVQARLGSITRKPLQFRRRPQRLFSSLIFCGVCGEKYASSGAGRYRCAGRRHHGTCANSRAIFIDQLEDLVLERISNELLSSDAVARYIEEYDAAYSRALAAIEAETGPLKRRAETLVRERLRLTNLVASGKTEEDDDDFIRSQINQRSTEIKQIRARLNSQPAPPVQFDNQKIVERLRDQIADIRTATATTDPEALRARESIRSLVDRITVFPHGPANGQGVGDVEIKIEGAVTALLENGADPSDGSQWRCCTGVPLRPTTKTWRLTSVLPFNPPDDRRRVRRPRTVGNMREMQSVLAVLGAAETALSVVEISERILIARGEARTKSNWNPLRCRVYICLVHLLRVGVAMGVRLPGRRREWGLTEKMDQLWPDGRSTRPLPNPFMTAVIRIFEQTLEPLTTRSIAAKVRGLPESAHLKDLYSSVRTCVTTLHKRGVVKMTKPHDRRTNMWILAASERKASAKVAGAEIAPYRAS